MPKNRCWLLLLIILLINISSGEYQPVIGEIDYEDFVFVTGIQCSIIEVNAEIPPSEKTFIYYFIIVVFIVSIIISTLLNGIFLAISIIFWKKFENLPFFLMLVQLIFFVFLLSFLNLIIHVPLTLFNVLTTEFTQSNTFFILSYTIDYCQYAILLSNLVIAFQRFVVFFLSRENQQIFHGRLLKLWLILIWLISLAFDLIMYSYNCQYMYQHETNKYVLTCHGSSTKYIISNPKIIKITELVIQLGVPCVIFMLYLAIIARISMMKQAQLNKQELKILKQALASFVAFQTASVIFFCFQTIQFSVTWAFLMKRVMNTAYLIAGIATPCFFFFSSRDMKKVLQKQVTASGEHSSSAPSTASSKAFIAKPSLRSNSASHY